MNDGSITLPTLLYCVENYSEDSYVIAGLERFKKDVTQHGVPSNIYEDYIRHIMANTEILPIHSHPRRIDTDGDGILDNLDRYNSETMDVRYRNVSPLRVNTIETLYPELKKSGQNPSNNEQNAVYFNIDGNDIELVARILFYDGYGQKFIENGVELNKTYEDVILEGLKLWSGKFTGAYSKEENVHYDFIEGMKINVTFTAEVYHEEDLFSDNRYVHIYVENDEYTGGKWYDGCYGIPHTDTQGWSPEKIGTGILWDCGQITMYPRYKDKPVSYTEMEYQHTIAHEFGHVLGLDDAYPGANGGIQLKNNFEVPIEEYYNGILMYKNGYFYANDMEMILQAFLERKYQSYFDYGKSKKSRVIRLKQCFEENSQ